MQQSPQLPQGLSPAIVCQQLLNARMMMYEAKQNFEAGLKVLTDYEQNLIATTNIMNARILELEAELAKAKKEG